MLFEWALSEAISTGLRMVGSLSGEQEEGRGGGGVPPVIGQASLSSPPPLPAITGIAAWDSALLLEHHRQKNRAEKAAAEAAGAAPGAVAEAAAAAREDEDPAIDWSNGGVASAQVSIGEDRVNDGDRDTKIGGGIMENLSVKALLTPTASTATTAEAAAIAASADGLPAAASSCDKIGDGNETTASENTDQTSIDSIDSSMASTSCCEEQVFDSSRGGQDCTTADREEEGEIRQDLPDVDARGPADSMRGAGGERGSQGRQDDCNEKRDQELQQPRVETLSESEKSPHEESARPAMTGGADGSRPRHYRRRKRKLNGFEGALELATRCLRRDGFNAKAYNLRAELETRLGRRDRAIADFRAAASLEVGDPRPRINMVGRLRFVRVFLVQLSD